MALASNQKEQMAKRLKADLEKLAPEFAASATQDASGNPVVELKSGATVIALLGIKRRSFDGFNIVAELSESAGQGYPEHEMWLVVKDDQTLVTMAKLSKAASAMGCSTMKVCIDAAPAIADIGDETKVSAEIANDARVGHSGN